jgi:hypothetical protein
VELGGIEPLQGVLTAAGRCRCMGPDQVVCGLVVLDRAVTCERLLPSSVEIR